MDLGGGAKRQESAGELVDGEAAVVSAKAEHQLSREV